MRERVTADDVTSALDRTVRALTPGVTLDWSVPAGELRWTCHRTAAHVADCLFANAGQIAAQPDDHWVAFRLHAARKATPADLLELLTASAGVLVATVRVAPVTARGYHPYGASDPEGFAAMCVVELLVHGADIAAGLSLAFETPGDVCRRSVDRLFPDVDDHDDQWELLQWATGRLALPDRP